MKEKKDEINKELLDNAISILGKTYNSPTSKSIEHAIEYLRKSMHEKKEVQVIRADKIVGGAAGASFLPFGVPWIDTWLRGGLRLQELMLIGAIPHAGKTHTLAWCGLQYLLQGHKVLDIIGEDLLEDVKDTYDKGLPKEAKEALQNLWLANVQDVSFGVKQVEDIYELLSAEGNAPTVVIIDHADLLTSTADKPDWEKASEAMVGLKMFAKRTNTIVITASQLNYDNKEAKGNARFYRAKVGKAANADVIMIIDDVIGDEYLISLTKARGRKKITMEEKQKTLRVSWDAMTIEDITQ